MAVSRRRADFRLPLLIGASALFAAAVPAAAQRPADSLVTDFIPVRTFGPADGLPRAVPYRVRALADGTLWLGSDAGAYRFDGRSWRRVPFRTAPGQQQVRDVAWLSDGTYWFATRQGVIRVADADTTFIALDDPGRRAPTWNILATSAFGPPTVVAALNEGLARWNGREFANVALPTGLRPSALVAAETRGWTGVPALWVGSLDGGLARLQGGKWTVFGPAQGIPANVRVEQITASFPGDRFEVLVVGIDGVYGFDGARFETLREQGDGYYIRGARVPSLLGGASTWVGLTNGDLLRRRDAGPWRRMQPLGQGPVGAPQLIDPVITADGRQLLFVGYRGGQLMRIRPGVSAPAGDTPDLRRRAIRAALPIGGDTVVIATGGGGVAEFVGRQLRTVAERLEFIAFHRAAPAFGGDVWAIAPYVGLLRRAGGDWRPDPSFPVSADRVPTAMGEAVGPDGRPALLVGTRHGQLHRRTADGWTPWADTPMRGGINALVADTIRGRPRLLVVAQDGLFFFDATTGWRRYASGAAPLASEPIAVAPQRLADGTRILWVGTVGHGLFRFDAEAAEPRWTHYDADSVLGFPSNIVRTLRLVDGDLFVGTSGGVARIRAGRSWGDSVRVVTTFAGEDGLPDTDVSTVHPSDQPGRLLVGTLAGLAVLRVDLPTRRPALADLHVSVRRLDSTHATVLPGAVLPWESRDLAYEFALRTDYREDVVRYRFVLDGASSTTQDWSPQAAAAFRLLTDGRYVMRVWAADAHGAVAGPYVHEFRVAPPLWRAPPVLAFYVVLVGAGLWLLSQWRTRALRRRQAELLANERRLARSEARFRRLFDEAADAQLLADRGEIVAANAAAGRLLADEPTGAPLIGFPVAELIPASAAVGAESSAGVETEARTLGGETRPVQLRRAPFPDAGPGMVHFELRDLRELRRLAEERMALEQQLRESQRLESLGTLAGGVAHDFNNLLTVIRNGAEMAREASRQGGTDPESVDAIISASTRARDLVRQMLAFSRRLPSRSDRLPVRDLLAELQPMLRALLPATVDLRVDDASGDAAVRGDRTQLNQVLVNLSTNAEYAMRATRGGTLAIAADTVTVPGASSLAHRPLPPGQYARLRFSDTGAGMREDVRARVFEPFFTTKPVGEGTGLGLAVLHGIILSHGGSVAVASEAGRGSTFEILLPCADGVAQPAAAIGATNTPPRSRPRVLLVDDELLVLQSTERVLARAGFEVVTASRGADALVRLESTERFDVVLTDLTMPDVSGETIARAVRERRPDVPVVVMTGFGAETDGVLRGTGVTETVRKPYEIGDLLAALARALGGRGGVDVPDGNSGDALGRERPPVA